MGCPSTALTAREWEVLHLLAQGKQYGEVADILIISPHTVHTYGRSIRLKLGACNAAHAVYLALAVTSG